jgi:hypothetical protein
MLRNLSKKSLMIISSVFLVVLLLVFYFAYSLINSNSKSTPIVGTSNSSIDNTLTMNTEFSVNNKLWQANGGGMYYSKGIQSRDPEKKPVLQLSFKQKSVNEYLIVEVFNANNSVGVMSGPFSATLAMVDESNNTTSYAVDPNDKSSSLSITIDKWDYDNSTRNIISGRLEGKFKQLDIDKYIDIKDGKFNNVELVVYDQEL